MVASLKNTFTEVEGSDIAQELELWSGDVDAATQDLEKRKQERFKVFRAVSDIFLKLGEAVRVETTLSVKLPVPTKSDAGKMCAIMRSNGTVTVLPTPPALINGAASTGFGGGSRLRFIMCDGIDYWIIS